jgi:hypothetical protein
MNTPISSLPPAFQALETRLADLQARFERGDIDASRYQAELQALTVSDEAGGTWWLGGETGAWHIWDGSKWVRSAPPAGAQPSVAPKPKPKRTRRPMIMGCGLGVLIVAVLVGVFLIVGWQAYQQEPKIVGGVEPEALNLASYALAADQSSLINRLGYPDAFAILFYEEEQVDGSFADVRFETWTYYISGLEFTFINGAQAAEDSLEIELAGELVPIPYRPEQFVAYMSLDEVIASADLETYLVVPLEKELVEGGEVYYADELTFGLKNDELLYVETLALESDE